MKNLETYHKALPYSVAAGIYPALICLESGATVTRALASTAGMEKGGKGMARFLALCNDKGLRVEQADHYLRNLLKKENVHCAVVFEKFTEPLAADAPHIVLVKPADRGNLGSILRSMRGFALRDLAIITPAADVYDPRTIRASMGALFGVRIHLYDSFEDYRADFPQHALYPFMLDGSTPLRDAVEQAVPTPYALVFGGEGPGLDDAFRERGTPVRIEMVNTIDSLNLAAAVSVAAYAFQLKTGGLQT